MMFFRLRSSFRTLLCRCLTGGRLAKTDPQADQAGMLRTERVVREAIAQRKCDAASLATDALFEKLGSGPCGLSDTAAHAMLQAIGPNEVVAETSPTFFTHLWVSYRNPFNLLLSCLAVMTWFTDVHMAAPGEGDWTAVIVIVTMVIVSALLRFVQERRSLRSARALRAMVRNTATVLRPIDASVPDAVRRDISLARSHSRLIETSMSDLVPGDVLWLSAGDMVPADCRVLWAKDLFVSQAALTGESLPVEKFAMAAGDARDPLTYGNLAFMGTNVVSGSALAIVLDTGGATYFGQLAYKTANARHAPTQFQQGVNRVSMLLIRFMVVMVPVVFLINGVSKGDWMQALLFALAVAVGLTPEMLPMIMTSTLAKGALRMAQRKVVVKRLDAIQNLGAMDVLCTDKTGTLTQDRVVLERYIDVEGRASDEVLRDAYLNSYYQTGLKSLLDKTVLDHAQQLGYGQAVFGDEKVDEIPFDFNRRRMSVVVSIREASRVTHHLICKGALEEMLSVCTHLREAGQRAPLDDARRARIRKVADDLQQEGLRVIAVASKDVPATRSSYGIPDESDLVLVGYVAFLDPPKDSAAPALAALRNAGVSIKLLTGDEQAVAQKVCRDVALPVTGVLVGGQIEDMDDPTLAQAVEKTTVFARLTPLHKERIIRLLRENGRTVGFLGDGINDAPALAAADVGISVDSAVDIARETADIILLEKSLMVLEEGVIEGRRIFSNMLKYLKMTTSSNFGNVFSVMIASICLPFLPMLPVQLLIQNLLYDFSQIAIPFDRVDTETLAKPQRWDTAGLGRFMVFFGPLSSIFDVLTFALMWYVFKANTLANSGLFHTGWFVEGLLSQTLVVHMIRTRHIPFLQSRAAAPLIVMTALIMLIGLILPFSPLAEPLGLQALPDLYFGFLLVFLLAYCALIQWFKGVWLRRYGWQ